MSTTNRTRVRRRRCRVLSPRLARTLLLTGMLLAAGCGTGRKSPPSGGDVLPATPSRAMAAAIREVLIQDDELSRLRNHAPETGPISGAIQAYVSGLDALDISGTPTDFNAALHRHRDAWAASIEHFRSYDLVRGEMHAIFEEIRAQGGAPARSLETIEADIRDTWAEVEALAIAYGALAPREER